MVRLEASRGARTSFETVSRTVRVAAFVSFVVVSKIGESAEGKTADGAIMGVWRRSKAVVCGSRSTSCVG